MSAPVTLHRLLFVALLLLPLLAPLPSRGAERVQDPWLWPEAQRAFLEDGPGLLLSEAERSDLLRLEEPQRQAFIDAFLASDPFPATPENELRLAIDRRRALVESLAEGPVTWLDVRARLLFLHGMPSERVEVECGAVFKPAEIWTYPISGSEEHTRRLVVFHPGPSEPWRLWLPLDSKRSLYTSEMEYWLEQWEQLRGRMGRPRRFDLQICKQAKLMDEVTGVRGLSDFQSDRPSQSDLEPYLEAPGDLASWSREALAGEVPLEPALKVGSVEVLFPAKVGQRILTRVLIELPPDAGLQVAQEEDKSELRLRAEGLVEQEGKIFEDFKVRFKLEPPAEGAPVALALERPLRPGQRFLLRLALEDEVGGAKVRLARGFDVPREPQVVEEPPVPEETVVAMAEELAEQAIPGVDSLILVPPESDVILGLWRAEALVTGSKIEKVAFLVDGTAQLTRSARPFTAEVRLGSVPREQVVRAEGYDAEGELVAADEIVVNQPRGALRVRILEPARGQKVSGSTVAKAEVVVPEERKVERVEVRLNEELVTTLDRPPWEARVEVPPSQEIAYLAVTAFLDDGSRAEDVRFLNSPEFLEEVDVSLVELYTAVTDRSGVLVRGLTEDDFEVFEDSRRQTVSKFELVENLPLTVCLTIDTSGSMHESMLEAKRAARGFLTHVLRPGDKTFAVAFSSKASLLITPTDDVRAVGDMVDTVQAVGWTALHDAIVTSLYYFRGMRGQKALVLLSDGDDTASTVPFRNALEYARRSGVAIYTIGLEVGKLNLSVRNKLNDLSSATGGRSFYISKAEELEGVYREIEEELRSRYLLAYASDRTASDEGDFREVEVKVKRRGLKARTIRGYYQ